MSSMYPDPEPQLSRKSKWALDWSLEFHRLGEQEQSTISRAQRQIWRHLSIPDLIRSGSDSAKGYDASPRVALDRTKRKAMKNPMRMRRSLRGKGPISREALSHLLDQAARVNDCQEMPFELGPPAMIRRRPYPSAGGLFPCETYVLLMDLEGEEPGICHYNAIEHSLALVAPCTREHMARAFLAIEEIENCAGIVVITAVLDRATAKYGTRGYRYALLEAGHLSQNICLASAPLGICCCPWGGYYDAELADLLGVAESEIVVATLLLGGKP